MTDDTLTTVKLNFSVSLITNTTVVGILYTFSFLLYCLCLRLFYLQVRRDLDNNGKIKRHTVFAFILASVIMACTTINAVSLNVYAVGICGDDDDDDQLSGLVGGVTGELLSPRIPTTLLIDDIASVVEMALTLGVLLWRVSVVWSGTRFVIPITLAFLLLYLASIGSCIGAVIVGWLFPSSSKALRTKVAVSDRALVAASLILMTSSIITRLILVRWQHIKSMGKSETAVEYLGVAAMLVESYSLNTIWYIGLVICLVLESTPGISFFNSSVAQIDALVYFLLVYRVYSGRAWDRQNFSSLSTLRWARADAQQTDATTGTVNVGTDHP